MRVLTALLLLVLWGSVGVVPAVPGASPAASSPLDGWRWPVDPLQIAQPYRAPEHRYGPGHRGIDVVAPMGAEVTAPAAGVVAFAGSVAGRPLVTIDHGEGLVSTLEPVVAGVPVGAIVRAGDVVGHAGEGGHSAPGTVHFGVREDGEYINPMLLMGVIPRAILLPCC